jgi:arsenate reductase-like glutaredoxin family protein
VKAYLSQKGVPFQVRDIRQDPTALKDLMNLQVMSTPAVRIGSQVIVGFNPRKIDRALAELKSPG